MSLPDADNSAVIPIKPAAQKFQAFILCTAFDNSVTTCVSSMPGFMVGNRHIADLNQNIAEAHAAISAPASVNDLIRTPDRPEERSNHFQG
jgi:hypothetical protein